MCLLINLQIIKLSLLCILNSLYNVGRLLTVVKVISILAFEIPGFFNRTNVHFFLMDGYEKVTLE